MAGATADGVHPTLGTFSDAAANKQPPQMLQLRLTTMLGDGVATSCGAYFSLECSGLFL